MTRLTINAIPGVPFGAEVRGCNPNTLDSHARNEIWHAYREHLGLLIFHFDRLLSHEEQHRLTTVFGENEFAPGRITGYGKGATDESPTTSIEDQVAAIRARGDDPYMAYIGNVNPRTLETDRTADDKFYGEWEWHTDMSYIPVPPTFSLLHARIVPESGGDTEFANQVIAAASLPAWLVERVQGLSIKHDSTYGSSGVLRPGMTPPDSPIQAIGHCHPILRQLSTVDAVALFLGRRTNAYIPGLSLNDSESLLDELWSYAAADDCRYRHRWQTGQVVVWDNRMMLHKRQPVAPQSQRFMWRTQTRGESVVAPWD